MITIGGMTERIVQPMKNKDEYKEKKEKQQISFSFCDNLCVNEKHHNIY
jgi:hypothetical protein